MTRDTPPFAQWAYKLVRAHNVTLDQFTVEIGRLGLDGWELVGFTNMDKPVFGGSPVGQSSRS